MERFTQLNLKALRAVDALARHGNLADAAEELCVSPGAISKHVINIEETLRMKLFRRTATGFKPVEQAEAFIAELDQGFRRLARSLDLLASDDPATIRMTVAPAFAKHWLIPRLPGFYAAHADVRIDIDAARDLVDLAQGDYDCAIRLGTGDWRAVEATRIMDQLLFPICAPELLGSLRGIVDLGDVGIISSKTLGAEWQIWLAANGADGMTSGRKLTLSDEDMCLAAALNGLGVTLSWQTQALDVLTTRRLVAPFPWSVPSGRSYWLAVRPRSRQKRALRLFRDWLHEEIAACTARSDVIPPPLVLARSA